MHRPRYDAVTSQLDSTGALPNHVDDHETGCTASSGTSTAAVGSAPATATTTPATRRRCAVPSAGY